MKHGLDTGSEKPLNKWKFKRATSPPQAAERETVPSAVCGPAVGGTLLRSRAMAGRGGKKGAGKRVEGGKGGPEVEKRSRFFHFETALNRPFPQFSTQVGVLQQLIGQAVLLGEGWVLM